VQTTPLSKDLKDTLSKITTASITTILLKKGLRNVWMRGTRPIKPGQGRLVGTRLHAALRAGARGSRHAGELVVADLDPGRHRGDAGGRIVVVDAMGVTDAGIFGDILCARMVKKRGVAGLITDGVVRDMAGVLGTGLPVWCQGAAAPPSVAGLTFVAGRSRSAAAAWRCSPTTWWWSTMTARC
jgi:regulator of RNase E activity RraA